MKIKYEYKKTYNSQECITLCPNGNKDVYVMTKSCTSCNFFVRPHVFSNAITCSYKKEKTNE